MITHFDDDDDDDNTGHLVNCFSLSRPSQNSDAGSPNPCTYLDMVTVMIMVIDRSPLLENQSLDSKPMHDDAWWWVCCGYMRVLMILLSCTMIINNDKVTMIITHPYLAQRSLVRFQIGLGLEHQPTLPHRTCEISKSERSRPWKE